MPKAYDHYEIVPISLRLRSNPLKKEKNGRVACPEKTLTHLMLERRHFDALWPLGSISTFYLYFQVWFHSTKKLIRRDFKKPSGSDPDPTIDIFDFNMGTYY